MNNDFDVSQLDAYQRRMLNIANREMTKETKKFLRKKGTELKKRTLANAKSKVKKKTGNYFKSIKRGKVYKYRANGALSIRVYSSAPHAHLIEEGHRQVTKDGREIGFVQGKHIFKESEEQFQEEYFNDAEAFIDEVLSQL